MDIIELKSRYKLLHAQQKTIQSRDMGTDIQISTGSPLIDSFLLEKIISTKTIKDYEHLARSWQLIQNMNDVEEKQIMENLSGFLNDHKLLLAMKYFNEGNENFYKVMESLPYSWKLLFPIAFIKPSHVFFDGWKKNLEFRLIDKFSFDKLRQEYAKILEEAGDTIILKYRERIHEATALLGYKFETQKEKAIHDWCYANGNNSGELPLIDHYTKARTALNKSGKNEFEKILRSSDLRIPITSYMGLLSSRDYILTSYQSSTSYMRDYAIECSNGIETLLRLKQWSPWLTNNHIWQISKKVNDASINQTIPFSKITQAYLQVPPEIREKMTHKIYIPLLKSFGKKVGELLPKKFTFFQPVNFIHIDNFLLYNIFNVSSKGKLVLMGSINDYEFTFTVNELENIVNMRPREMQQFLLNKFGGLTTSYSYLYSTERALDAVQKLDQTELLILNTPYYESLEIVDKLRNWKKIINLSSYLGMPSEIPLNFLYTDIVTVRDTYKLSRLHQDPAVYNAVTYLEKLSWFEKIAEGIPFDY